MPGPVKYLAFTQRRPLVGCRRRAHRQIAWWTWWSTAWKSVELAGHPQNRVAKQQPAAKIDEKTDSTD